MDQARAFTAGVPGIVRRERLDRVLAGAWQRRITLVAAGGGYGKTTALRQLEVRGPVRWLELTPADRDIEVLAARLLGMLGSSGATPAPVPAIEGAAALGATDRERLAQGRAAQICERLDVHDGPLMLVLDNVDQVRDDDSASRLLAAVCLQAPTHAHLVLSGRRLPALGLGAATGRGELLEVSAPDLAFTPEETDTVLTDRLGPQAGALANQCWALSSGWPAALQLIADRLERVEPSRWPETLGALRQRRGPLWQDFAAELIERESPEATLILTVAGIAPVIDAQTLSGLGLAHGGDALDSLQRRGLLVAAGEVGTLTLSPVLEEAMVERLATGDAQALRTQVADALEHAGRPADALESLAPGPPAATAALLLRQGRRLVAGGHSARVRTILDAIRADGRRGLDPAAELELEAIRAEALVAVGDWDLAMDGFASLAERSGTLAPATAWRYGALLYLRNDIEAAAQILSAAHQESGSTSDDALVSAWLSATLWGRGENEEAVRLARVALRQAQAGGDPAARAAAHIAVALAAAGSGDREENERHYRLALAAAAEAGDSIQLARIHANLSSRAAEDGDYARALEEADLSLQAGAGHSLFAAVAASNKAEALMHTGRVEEAHALLGQAIEMFSSLGSLASCVPYLLLGLLEAERGELTRARITLERALRLADTGSDMHCAVLARAALARVLARDDSDAARAQSRAALEDATGLERARALWAAAWVELCAGDRGAAAGMAAEAQAEARRTGDRPTLAASLELRGVCFEPPDEAQLEAAVELCRELGDPIAAARAGLTLAACRSDHAAIADLRDELIRQGVQPEAGVAGLFLAGEELAVEIAIATLGRFTVLRRGEPIPLTAWQSRKARDLLKLLAARRGRPITRDAVAEALWPDEDPAPLSNRLSVALSTLRKVLDPERTHPPDHFVAADHQALFLRLEHLELDVVSFLVAAGTGIRASTRGAWPEAEESLRQAERLYTGDFLEEDLYEDWPVDCREEARSAAQEVSRLLARAAAQRGDEEEAARQLRRLLERDRHDADAWAALLGTQLRLRRYGEARRQYAVYARCMAELGLAPSPLAQTAEARP